MLAVDIDLSSNPGSRGHLNPPGKAFPRPAHLAGPGLGGTFGSGVLWAQPF